MKKIANLKQFEISKYRLKKITGSDGNACLSGCTRGCSRQATTFRDTLTCYAECQAFC